MKQNLSFLRIVALLFFGLFFLYLKPLWAQEEDTLVVTLVVGKPEYVILAEEGEGFKIAKRGPLNEGAVLPRYYCTVCLPEDTVAVLKDKKGEEIELYGPDVYDAWKGEHRVYKKEQVKVAEGVVVVQSSIEVEGKIKPVGEPIILRRGSSVEIDPCFTAIRTEFLEGTDAEALAQAAQQATLSDPTEDPIDGGDEPPSSS